MYVVGKTWCHNVSYDTTKKKEYTTYKDAKLAYDRMVKNERTKTSLYGYKRCILTNLNSKDESAVFTDNNIHIDRNDYNFCEVFLYECSIQKGWRHDYS